ncbi:hypothetical protein [Arthrobacter sp. UYEF3]|uniref:hypothetical protein n=1 Tax=Arthrobacter sp. UYEF3 TaxID=1756365 RepID=UPI00339B1F06
MEKRQEGSEFQTIEQQTFIPIETSVSQPAKAARGGKLAIEDWVLLNPGYRVRVQRENESVTAGFVDVVAPDASVFWVWLDDGRGRVALHEHDNVAVWLEEDAVLSSRFSPVT